MFLRNNLQGTRRYIKKVKTFSQAWLEKKQQQMCNKYEK